MLLLLSSSYPILVFAHLSSFPILSTFYDIIWSSHLILPWMLWLHLYCSISWWCMGLEKWEWSCSCCLWFGKIFIFEVWVMFFELLKWDFTSFFIGFNSNTFSNNLQSPLLYEATLISWFIDHVCPHNLSNAPSVMIQSSRV